MKTVGALLGSAVAARVFSEEMRDIGAEQIFAVADQHFCDSRNRSTLIHRRIRGPK